MSKSSKVVISLVGTIAIFAIVFTIIIKTQITPERVRKTLLPLVEASLQRNVDFGEINIGIFSGISVADLKVTEKSGAGELFYVETMELRYQFWPLFMGKVVIDQALLHRPEIFVSRLPDGSFNFSDLIPSDKNGTAGGNDKIKTSAKFNLLVKEVKVVGGELLYVDKFINAKSPYRYHLKDLNFKAKQFSLANSFPVELSAVINGASIDVSGKYDISNSSGAMTINLGALDLVKFAPYYRNFVPAKLGSADLSLNLEVDISPEFISSKGKIICDKVDLVLNQFPDGRVQQATLGVNYAINLNLQNKMLHISTLLFNFNDISFGGEGELDLSTSEPIIVFSLLFKQFDLRKVMQNLPLELTRDYQKYSIAGTVNGKVDLAGKLNNGIHLFQSAKLNLTDVRATADTVRAGISGDVSYSNNILKTDNLQLQYGDQQLQLQLNAVKTGRLFRGDFALTADTLDINKVIPERSIDADNGEQTAAAKKSNGQSSVQNNEIGPFDIPVNLVGTLAVNRLIYKKLDITKLAANIKLRNNTLSLSNLFGKIGGGKLNGSAVVDFGVKGLAYNGQIALGQPDIATLIDGLMLGANQEFSGTMQWRNSFSGRGTGTADLLRQLQLKGTFDLYDGSVKGSPLLLELANFVADSDLQALSFDSFTGNYLLQNSQTNIDALLDSSKTKLATSGTISTDGELNLKLNTKFAPVVMSRLGVDKKVKQMVVDSSGWGALPLLVGGTVNQPVIGFDADALQAIAISRTKEKVSQELLEKYHRRLVLLPNQCRNC